MRHHILHGVNLAALFLGALLGIQIGIDSIMHFGRQRADGVANLGFLAFNARSACTQAAGALHATHGSDMAEALCTSLVHGAVDAKDIKHEGQCSLGWL